MDRATKARPWAVVIPRRRSRPGHHASGRGHAVPDLCQACRRRTAARPEAAFEITKEGRETRMPRARHCQVEAAGPDHHNLDLAAGRLPELRLERLEAGC